ncbi:MAG: SiaB family protein kinase [Flavobacteriales bacterium]|nr:SiaB family protein kinase [Flavobacteriales bacterium]
MTVNIDNIYGIHHKMLDKKILLAYKGDFNHGIVNALLTNAKSQMEGLGLELATRKKLYNIMVECLENINRYAGEGAFETRLLKNFPLFLLGMSESGYYITVGNLIKEQDKEDLKIQLDDVNKLNRDELKEKYRGAILKAEVTEGSGAGLGIIDMAIKSDNRLEYTFNDVKDDISFFILEIKV